MGVLGLLNIEDDELEDEKERGQKEREKAGDDSSSPARLQNLSRLVSRLRDRVRKRLSRVHH